MKNIVTIFLLLCSLGVFSQAIYYVRPTGNDASDGTTWSTALKTPQKALEKAVYGDQVWVAQGTYYPDEKDAANSDLRTVSFVMKPGVKIYGGFPDTGNPGLSDRNWQTNVTILSGDLLQNDGAAFAGNADNAYHVVRSASLNSIAVLDGFTIKGGNADASDASSMLNGMGGGLLNEASSPLITHCTLTGNSAAFLGGGLLNYNGSSPTITHCTFTGNKGGGITNGLGYPGSSLPPEVPNAPCSPTISNCSFTASVAGTDFGIVNFLSTPTITNCSFTGSTAGTSIGIGNFSASPTITGCSFTQLATGIGNDLASPTDGPSSPTITHCTFTGNTGAGIANASASPTITYCTFTGNTATTSNNGFGAGAAILIGTNSSATTPSSATITHCSFTNNTAESMGGAIVNSNSSATLINCRFSGNSAQLGGAIASAGTSALNALTLTNCTFYGNTATAAGGAILKGILTLPMPLPLPFPINDASTLSINNSILWGNSAPADAQITIGSPVVPVVTYSLVQGGTTDNHNLDTDPQFADAANGDLHLLLGSPAIDAGDNAAVPQGVLSDLDGNPRIYNNTVDLGAYEFLPGGTAGGIIYVKHDASGQNDGTSWTDAFRNLQDALAKAGTLNGFVTIWVARGTYYPDMGTGYTENARTAAFGLRNNTSLYGGFAGTETLFSERNWQTNVTVLSGDLLQNDGAAFANNSDNAYHVVAGTNVNHTAVLDGFTIKGGNANGSGAHDWGGALFNENGSPTIANCRFEENTAVNGGAVGNNFSSPTITHCSFVTNSASKGGGIYNSYSSPVIANCLFRNNDVNNAGGALFSEATSSPRITNCTFAKNKSWNEGGGIYNTGQYSAPIITNSILWENIMRRDGDALNQITNSDGATPVVRYSLVQGGYTGGTSILDKNPFFVDAATGDLHLQACSPAINVGNNADVPPGLATDLEGNPRIFPLTTGTVDMGAYEAQSTGCCPSGNVLYVKHDASGLDNGTSWTDAFTSLQDALAQTILCPTVTQVWVAQGTYYPDKGRNITEDDRAASFMLKNGVALYGGFAGGETTLSQRNGQTNVTTLSGEIQNNASNVDNSYHVVTGISLGNTAVLDGFTITGGNASGNSNLTEPYAQYVDAFGGGLFNNASSPVINNCTFSGNTGNGFGGNMGTALFNYNGSSPTITHCTFTGNTGMAVLNGFGAPGLSLPAGFPNAPCSPTITNCSFTGNTSLGIGNLYSSATITGCTFHQNGVGISNGYSSPTITNCSFSGHTSGAITNMSSSATITHCTFTGNTTPANQFGGGAIYNGTANASDPPSSATITHCSFTNNTAESMGGAILNANSSATLTNCRFSGNSAQLGGAIASAGTSALNALTLTNCTFYGNTATAGGGAILKGIFIFPIPLPFPLPIPSDASTLTLTNCILWGNSAPTDAQISTGSTVVPVVTYSLVQGGTTDNHNLDTDPQFADAANGDLHLLLGSPAIDAGNNAAVPQGILTDLDGSPRIYNNTVDLGAYEYLPCGAGGTIYVKHDATGNGDGTSWTHAFRSLQDALTRANYCANITQIWVARGTYVPDATGSNRAASFVLKNNLAIYGGFAGTETELTARNMKLQETFLSGEIQDDGNSANNSYHVVRSISLNHTARLDGFTITGGAANGSAAPDNGGGGIYSSTSQALIINCRLVHNTAQYGGAIFIDGSYTHFINCSFSQNTATGQGGALYNGTAPSSSVLNCSFSGNTAPEGGGIYNDAPIFSISNSILWGNSGGEVVNAAGKSTTIFYSVVQGGTTNNNNLATDPLFMNAAGGDLRLQGCSPAINVGHHDANVFTTDADGAPRKAGIIDMGAYEFQPASGVGIVYVKGDATGNGDGTSWTNAFTNLQDALTRATTCGGYQVQIWVAKGTYYPDEGTGQTNNSRAASFGLKNGIAIFGGFAGTETLATQRNALQNPTILSGDIDGDGTLAANSYHVVTAASVDQSASLFDVTITGGNANGSAAPDNGGGGLLISSATPTVYNCTFTANTATYGGALYASAAPGYSVRVTRCTFSGNTATSGGAIYSAPGSGLYITNGRFSQNTATDRGGGLYINHSVHMTNSLFWNNAATVQGGAIYNHNTSNATIFNCSFAGNTAPAGNGGALYNNSSTVTIANTILWGNSSAIDNSGSTPAVSYSLVQEGTTDNHNLNADPQFADAATGNLHLQPCSPAIDAGDNAVDAGYEDLDNNPRERNDRVDMGAYEAQSNLCCPSGGVLFVKHDASGKNTGTSWTDAFTSLQDALAHTSICTSVTQVWVAAGTYYPGYGREASFVLKNGLALYGGFAGTEESLDQRDWTTHVTTLSGDVDRAPATATGNSYHVVTATSLNNTAVLDGFTITGGNANGHYLNKQDQGAGMYNQASSPTIANCSFTNNTAGRFGGAMYNDNGSSPAISNCSFTGNTAVEYQGGGIYNYMSSPTITYCNFANNTAGSYGGGIYNATGASATISNCFFTGNTGSDGGAIGNFQSTPTIKNSSFIGNSATHTGGGLFNFSASPNVFNCSFTANTASSGNSGGIYNTPGSTPIITNCILWGNGSEIVSSNTTPVVSYSIVQNGTTDNHNLNTDPQFADAANGDLRLLPGSPAIDAGNNTVVSDGDLDLEGKTRIMNSVVDIGAYEVQGTPVTIVPPADFTLPNDAGVCSAVVNFTGEHEATASGGTGTITITYEPATGSALPAGLNTVTATASDEAGHTASATFTVTVADKEGPAFTAPVDQEVVINESCQVVVPDLATGLSGTDNCGGAVTFTQNHAQGDILPATHGQTFTVSITATDDKGNTTTHTVTLTAADKTAPVPDVATLPDITGECSVTVGTIPTASDLCGGTITATTSDPLSYTTAGSYTIRWTYDDGHGNTATQDQTVVVNDLTAPTITAPADVNTSTDAGQCSASGVLLGNPSGSDNCGGVVTFSSQRSDGLALSAAYPVGKTTITWTATDGAGLKTTADQSVIVADNEAPGFTAPADRNVELGNNCSFVVPNLLTGLTGTDNCGTVTFSQLPAINDVVNSSHGGITTVIITARDASGNQTSKGVQLRAVDITYPTISAPADVTLNVDAGSCVATNVALGTPVTADNCPGKEVTSDAPATFTLGTHTVTWRVTDAAGHSATATQQVTIADNINPSITCPANIRVNAAAGQCSAEVNVVAGASDNCGAPTVTYLIAGKPASSPYTFPVGETLVTATATDAAGNTAQCSFTVTVVDNQPPTFTRPKDITIYTGPGCTYDASVARTGDVTNEADNCPTGLQATFTDALTGEPCSGTKIITRTWSLNDAAGNSAVPQVQTITVKDNTPPSFTRPADITIYTDATCGYNALPAATGDVSDEADNCSTGLNAQYSDKVTGGPCAGSAIILRTWTLVDACSNSAVPQVQTITVKDNTPPSFTAPKAITISMGPDCTYDASPAITGNVTIMADNCDKALKATYSDVVTDGTCTGRKVITRTWRLKDACGNQAKEQVQIITVNDNTPPTFTRPADVTIASDATCSYNALPSNTGDVTNEADNCSAGLQATFTDVTSQGSCAGETIITRTWHLKDACGNLAPDQVQIITVKDNTPPVARCQNIEVYLGSDGTVSITPAQVDNGSSDACSAVTLAIDKSAFTTANVGANSVVLTVTDACGNGSSCTATVTVNKRPVTLTYTGDGSEQYSDQQALTATLADQLTHTPLGGKTITFTLGTQAVSGTTDAAGQVSTNLILTQDPALTYTVKTAFAGDALYAAGQDEDAFDIVPEDARVTYTGSLFSSTSGITSSQATVTLSATIQDISATTNANGDLLSGDIRKARVQFINADNGTPISGWLTPGVVTEGDRTTGTVTYNWAVNIGSANAAEFTIGILVDNGYYLRNSPDDYTVVSVAKPLADFVSGGGYLVLQAPAGLKAGDLGSKNNVGFNVKYNKSGRNLQGSINTLVRRTESDGLHIYQIKGNAMTSLALNGTVTAVHPYPTAIFDGKASIQDITNPLLPISVDGNASLHVEMTDRGEPGNTDGIAITVWDKDGGLWFASNWSGTRTTEQALDAGNLKVSAGGSAPPPPPPPPPADTRVTVTELTSSPNPSARGETVTFTARVIPQTASTTVPTGKITFYDGNTALRTVSLLTVQGVATATYSTSKLTAGDHVITSVYSGDRTFTGSVSNALTQVVGAPVVLAIDPKTVTGDELQVTAYPNPAPYSFNLAIRSRSDRPVTVRIVDAWGRVLETRGHIAANTTLTVGDGLRPGIYQAEVVQGGQKVTVKLVKQSD